MTFRARPSELQGDWCRARSSHILLRSSLLRANRTNLQDYFRREFPLISSLMCHFSDFAG